MLIRPDSARYDDIITDAALAVVGEHGTAGLTVRSLAARIGVTPPALINRYRARDEMIAIVLRTSSERWTSEQQHQWIVATAAESSEVAPLAALLSGTAEVDELRSWLALLVMARSDSRHARIARRVSASERVLIATTLTGRSGISPSPSEVDLVQAALEGLRVAMTESGAEFSSARGSAALEVLVRSLGAGGMGAVA